MKKYLFIVLLVGVWSCDIDSTKEVADICDDTISDDAKAFADDNWNLQSWWNFTISGPSVIENNGIYFTDNRLRSMRSYIGTYHIHLKLSGQLATDYGEIILHDSLHLFSQHLNTPNVQVVKDSTFYKYIAEYDQFLGGWSDASSDWYWEEIPDVDSTKIVVKTPLKQGYLDMLPDCE